MADNNRVVRVTAAVADKNKATLYLDDGNTIVIKQGDHRLGEMLDKIIPITARGEIAVVDLTEFSVYAAFEKKSNGLTKMFKVAKDKISGWFGKSVPDKVIPPEPAPMPDPVVDAAQTANPMASYAPIPPAPTPAPEPPIVLPLVQTHEEAVAEHGTEVDMTDEVDDEHTVVAVVTNPTTGEKKAIPGIEKMKTLIDHAVRANSPTAVNAFLARCATFIDKRQHSVEDLMKFLEKGDLPLAEDGCIIAYKMLNFAKGETDVFVDCHSGNIRQKIGSYVCVNENLVDLNRRNECSNGLHIARRAYLKGFGGNVCVLCKIDPEDVMVVPHNDANKVRVKGYHILFRVSDGAMEDLKANRPMTGENRANQMVLDAIKGNHVGRKERVQVNGQMGQNVTITKLKTDQKGSDEYDVTDQELRNAAALDDARSVAGTIEPRDINKRVTEEIAKANQEKAEVETPHSELNPDAGVTGKGTQADFPGSHVEDKGWPEKEVAGPADGPADKPLSPKQVEFTNLLLDFHTSPDDQKQAAALAVIAFKKKAKKGWDKLEVTGPLVGEILNAAYPTNSTGGQPALAPPSTPAIAKPSVEPKEKKAKATPTTKVVSKAPAPKPEAKVSPAKSGSKPTDKPSFLTGGTKAEQARALYIAKKFGDLWALKKQAKKSWETLGFNAKEIQEIEARK